MSPLLLPYIFNIFVLVIVLTYPLVIPWEQLFGS